MNVTIEITPEETLANIRRELPLGGDWALVREGDEAILWIDITSDGRAFLSDFNTSVRIDNSEPLHAIVTQWLADVS